MLILDPLSELHDAQENDNTALRHIVAELRVIARTRNIGILLLHHTPKGVPRPGDQDAGRGASAISGVVRKSYTLYEMTKEELSNGTLRNRSSISGLMAPKQTMMRRTVRTGLSGYRSSWATVT